MKNFLKTVPNVEIMRAGVEYKLSTGNTTFTPEDLRDVVMAANEDSSIPLPRLKLGHTDPRFNDTDTYDATPAFGKASNLRLSDNGMAVLADYVGVPSWLADIMASAYPSRSIEGHWNVRSGKGKDYRFILTACSLLGVVWPGITVLEDLPLYYGDQIPPGVEIVPDLAVAHATGGNQMKTNASANLDDIRRAFYQEYIPENPDSKWWWICAVVTDPNQLVVEDDESGQLYMIDFSSDPNGGISFSEPSSVRIEYVPDSREGKAAAAIGFVAAASAMGREVLASWTTRAASRPDTTEGGAMDAKELRVALGLPEDASDEQVQDAYKKLGEAIGMPGGTVQDPPEPTVITTTVPTPAPTPVAVVVPEPVREPETIAASTLQLPPGTVLVDEATFASMQMGLERVTTFIADNDKRSRENLVAAAIADGRIPPARRDHWLQNLEQDPEGYEQALASLAPVVPIGERGHSHSVAPEENVALEQETVQTWTQQLFPETRASAPTVGRSSRIQADASWRR